MTLGPVPYTVDLCWVDRPLRTPKSFSWPLSYVPTHLMFMGLACWVSSVVGLRQGEGNQQCELYHPLSHSVCIAPCM